MKRITAIFLSIVLLLTNCVYTQSQDIIDTDDSIITDAFIPDYKSLDDPELLSYVENLVYQETITSLNSEEYFVEDVSAIYISKEYMEEVAYNSHSNIYFGYTLDEIDEVFQDTKYVFTLGENGETIVKELEEIEDTTMEAILKNVAIGTGVILVCVTVSAVTAGAPAVSMIFAMSATGAKTLAVSSAALGGISAGTVRGIETGDFGEVIEAAAIGASEGFKWGAISGAIIGGASGTFILKSLSKNGLKMNDVALIQKESWLPTEVISQLNSMDEYNIYKSIGLKTKLVNGKTSLIPDIDLKYTTKLPNGTKITNLERMRKGLAAIDPSTGMAYEVHHIGQKNNGVFAILTQEQHRGTGNFAKLHHIWKDSGVEHGSAWKKTKSDLWKKLGEQLENGGI